MKTRIRVALPATLVAVSMGLTACGGDKTPTASAPTTATTPAASSPPVPLATLDHTVKCLSTQGFTVHKINVHRLRVHFQHSKPVTIRLFPTVAAAAAVAPPVKVRKDGSFSDLGWTLLNNSLVRGKGYLHNTTAVQVLAVCLSTNS